MGTTPTTMASTNQLISKRRKFVADGVFYAELSEFFSRELANEGYSGCEIRQTHARCEVVIRATHTQGVLGIKVKIMLPWDPSGAMGPTKPLPDMVTIVEPKEESLPSAPVSDSKVQDIPQQQQQAAPAAPAQA